MRATRIIARIIALGDAALKQELELVYVKFKDRHENVQKIFLRHFEIVKEYMITDLEPTEERKLLIGAYFTSEYSLESAALCNPSIVLHPDQTGAPEGCIRFIMSLRALGEGHISSIEFRSGLLDKDNNIELAPLSGHVSSPDRIEDTLFTKQRFAKKLFELGVDNDYSNEILDRLEGDFYMHELVDQVKTFNESNVRLAATFEDTTNQILWLAESNYEVKFNTDQALSERVIFPHISSERKGIEDARFVQFNDGNEVIYYATYTAYDGRTFLPQLLETRDFNRFKLRTLNGKAVQNKGFALFPRKINGKYVMLSRQDNENIFLMESDDIDFWQETKTLVKPSFPWEYVQLGNCGSPIETEAGWLVLTHGVGPMRRYCIGVILLDLDDPSKVIGRLKQPLIEPEENEREGYVPNVVYSCGALLRGKTIIIPYAMADYATTVALVDCERLLNELKQY